MHKIVRSLLEEQLEYTRNELSRAEEVVGKNVKFLNESRDRVDALKESIAAFEQALAESVA